MTVNGAVPPDIGTEVLEHGVRELDPVRHFLRLSSSTCIRAQNTSTRALSRAAPTVPIEASRPDSLALVVKVHEVNWVP